MRNRESSWFRIASLVVVATALAGAPLGCATQPMVSETEVGHFLADKPAELHAGYRRLLVEGTRNRVLNEMRIGIQALESGRNDLAARAFDDAIAGIEAVYA